MLPSFSTKLFVQYAEIHCLLAIRRYNAQFRSMPTVQNYYFLCCAKIAFQIRSRCVQDDTQFYLFDAIVLSARKTP